MKRIKLWAFAAVVALGALAAAQHLGLDWQTVQETIITIMENAQ